MKKPYYLQTRKEILPVPFDFDGRILIQTDELEVIHLVLKPGEIIGMHSQPIPVSFFVLAGEGILTIGSDTIQSQSEMMINVEPDVMRSWKNTGTDQLKLLVIKKL